MQIEAEVEERLSVKNILGGALGCPRVTDLELDGLVEIDHDLIIPDDDGLDDAEIDLEPAEEKTEDGEVLGDPILVLLNVLSIVATKNYPYGGYLEHEDADLVQAHWGGQKRVDRYSEQE